MGAQSSRADAKSNCTGPHIIVTILVLLDSFPYHSRAWLPREESRAFRLLWNDQPTFLARAGHVRGNHNRSCIGADSVARSYAGLNSLPWDRQSPG